jgi:hypothetical protein
VTDGTEEDTADRILPVNLITATRLRRVPLQRVGFLLSKSPDWMAAAFDEQALADQLKTFNFLHTARWVYLGRFPKAAPAQARERLLGPRWVVYVANYDGPWKPYFGTFMEAMGEGVYDIWGQSVGYPGFPAPGTANRLRAWLQTRLPESDHYYCAYPWATANDVRAAVRVRREVGSTALDLVHAGAGPADDVTPAFDALAGRLRQCASPIAPPRWPAPAPGPQILPDGTLRGFVAVFPVAPGQEGPLRDAVAGLPTGTASPFRRIPGVHFARLAVLDRLHIGCHPEPRDRIETRNSYLLLAADFDAVPPFDTADRAFLESLEEVAPEVVEPIRAHCWGLGPAAAPGEFAGLGLRCRRPFLREFIDCPDQSLGSVLAALGSHGRFVELVRSRSTGARIDAGALLGVLDP